MEFKVGDKAVYPARGVGVVRAVEALDIDGARQTFYVLKILDNGLTIKVPVQNASALGMRNVVSLAQVEKTVDILKDRDVPPDKQTWNRRFREYQAKIQTGDILEVARVYRDLALVRRSKNLSFGERNMYDQARSLLVQEIAVARDLDEKTVEDQIDEIFKS